jgi:uncharacterized protein YjbI with pentapeptide repeats
VVGLVGLASALWGPSYLVAMTTDRAKVTAAEWSTLVTSARQAILFGAGGVIALITVGVTWARDRATRAQLLVQRSQLRLQQRQLEMQQDSSFSDRYAKGVEQLGEEGSLTTRLGGIALLRRVGTESEVDRPNVVELLSRWVRAQAIGDYEENRVAREKFDVRAALEAIVAVARVPEASNEHRADLRGVDFRGVNLSGLDLSGLDLTGAQLEGADLSSTNLRDSRLDHITAGARTSFYRADLSNARLVNAQLSGANLLYADFTEAMMLGADLSESSLAGATWVGADLSWANLAHADLSGADFTGVELTETSVEGTDFRTVRNLDKANVEGVKVDADTAWPDRFVPRPSDWRKVTE